MMTDDRGQVVTLNQRDWVKILCWGLALVTVVIASWTTLQVSVARLEAQVDGLQMRIGLLEDTVKAHAWTSTR